MTKIKEIKLALAEDTMVRAIAPAMEKRHAARRAKDKKRRINEGLAKRGIPLRVV